MNKKHQLLATLCLLLVAMTGRAETVSGSIKADGKALGEVLVTDGFTFAVTDNKGYYSIELNEKAEFVYILTPKGYVADFSSGVPQFYQRIEANKEAYDFDLKPMKGDPDRFAMITMADTQLDTGHDTRRLMTETLPDMQATLAQYKDVQTAGIVLGDISTPTRSLPAGWEYPSTPSSATMISTNTSARSPMPTSRTSTRRISAPCTTRSSWATCTTSC